LPDSSTGWNPLVPESGDVWQPERLALVVLPFLAESQSAGLDSIQTSQILTIWPDLAILPVLTGFGRLLAILKIIF